MSTRPQRAVVGAKRALDNWSTWGWAPRGQTQISIFRTNNKGARFPVTANDAETKLRYVRHLEMNNQAYKSAKNRIEKLKKTLPPRKGFQVGLPRVPSNGSKKQKTVAGLPSVNRYNTTNRGYVPRSNANYKNNPNANKNNAGNKFTFGNGNNENNTTGYGPGPRYRLEPVLKPANKALLEKKSLALASLANQINVQGAPEFQHLLGKAFKMLIPGTAQSFIGSKLETVAFDLAGKSSGMHTVYFTDPWSKRNAEGLPLGLGSQIVNVVKLYKQFPKMVQRPTMILKSRFSFAKSIKTSGELESPMGQNVWWPIIRAGSYNPFYYESVNGSKKYVDKIGGPGWHYTPFMELRQPGRGLGGEPLYKGYTAVEPDVIIYYPPEYQLPGHTVGPKGEFRICELKAGPGANHKGVPAESFQLIKAKRSVQMAFERALRRENAQVTTVPDISLCFIPWFYARVRGGKVNFENIYNSGAYDKRPGHEATRQIAQYLGPSWKVSVLNTEQKVTDFTGINAAVATVVLDAYRKKDMRDVRLLLQHINKYGLTESGRNKSIINKAMNMSRIAHPTHGQSTQVIGQLAPGSNIRKTKSEYISGGLFRTPNQADITVKKSIARLISYGLLRVTPKTDGNSILPFLAKLPGFRGTHGYATEFSNSNNNNNQTRKRSRIEEDKKVVMAFLSINNNTKNLKFTPSFIGEMNRYNFTWVNKNSQNRQRNIYRVMKNRASLSNFNKSVYTEFKLHENMNNTQIQQAFINAFGSRIGQRRYVRGKSAYANAARQSGNQNVNMNTGNIFGRI